MFTPKLITESIKEAVSLAELKLHCQLDSSDHDTILEIYRVAARRYFEERTCRAVHEKTLEWVLDKWPDGDYIVLPRATPLIGITSIKYKDSAGTEETWAASNYIADTDPTPGRVALAYGCSWPSTTLYPVSAIRVRYRAGQATTSPPTECVADIKLPVLMLAKGMFEFRDPLVVTPTPVSEIAQSCGAEAFMAGLIVHG